MGIKLSCLACGHRLDLGDAYEDYEGEVRCWGCDTALEVALHEGKLRSMRRSTGDASGSSAGAGPPPTTPPDGSQASPAAATEAR